MATHRAAVIARKAAEMLRMDMPGQNQPLSGGAKSTVRLRLLSRRMIILLHLVRSSGRLTYGRDTGISEFDWRVILETGIYGQPLVSELAGLLDVDKAQVSRAVNRLIASGLLHRPKLRDPVRLSTDGQRLYERLRQLALARNRMLLAGVPADHMPVIRSALAKVGRAAEALLEEEREGPTPSAMALPQAAADDSLGGLIIPEMLVTVRTIRRGTVPAYKRLSGLSDLEWIVLAWIYDGEPLTLTELIARMERDKSQIGRVIKRMLEIGLVDKDESAPRRILLSVTEKGRAVFHRLELEARRRDDIYRASLTGEEDRILGEAVDQMIRNAEQILSYERAIAAH